MPAAAVALALTAAFCFGLGLILSHIGLRGIAPVAGAAISIPTSTVLFVAVAPFTLDLGAWSWPAVAIFAAVGLLYPATGTLLTFAANRRLGPVITGTFGNLAPIFAVTLAFLFLGEPVRAGQLVGLAVIVAGVMVLTVPRGGRHAHWRSWFLLLPLVASGIRGLVQPTIKYGLTLWPSPVAATLVSYLVSTAIVLDGSASANRPSVAGGAAAGATCFRRRRRQQRLGGASVVSGAGARAGDIGVAFGRDLSARDHRHRRGALPPHRRRRPPGVRCRAHRRRRRAADRGVS